MLARQSNVHIAIAGIVAFLISPLVSRAVDQPRDQKVQDWQVGFSPTYMSGNYGTSSTTSITYLPLSIRRLFDNGDLTFTVPYLCVTGNGAVTVLSGTPNRVSKSGTATTGQGGGKGKKPGNVEPTSSTECGIGDLIFRGRYYLVDEHGPVPTVAVTGRVKIPTADADRGLGTGRFDEGVGVEMSKKLIGNWMGFVDFGYTFIGDPEGVNLRNQWYYDFGVGYNVTNKLLVSMYYEEYRALIEGLSNPRDLLFALNYTASSSLRFNASILAGLSSGAPDYGLTGGISWRF
ncbi:MAG TPA: transporter [Nitrospiraceae bacterium]